MHIDILSGRHFSVDGQKLVLFGHQMLPRDGKWAFGTVPTGISDVAALLKPDPVSTEIEGLINGDTVVGNAERIDHILISVLWACVLWAEGKLTLDHLRQAQEDHNTVTVTMWFGGVRRPVKIRDRLEVGFNAATMDIHGNPI